MSKEKKHTNHLKSCDVCGKMYDQQDVISADLISDTIYQIIQKEKPNFNLTSLICKEDLNRFRSAYVKTAIQDDMSEITQLEDEVLKSIQEYDLITDNLNKEYDKSLSFGERLSDNIAAFGGSWKFIIIFVLVISSWIMISGIEGGKSFDPYPYILLNLVLSCIAAIQAPVIMMSQNRQEAKDRLRAELDYKVNLKAELEIRHLKLKLDQLASHQWQRLLEIQRLQTELIEEVAESQRRNK